MGLIKKSVCSCSAKTKVVFLLQIEDAFCFCVVNFRDKKAEIFVLTWIFSKSFVSA